MPPEAEPPPSWRTRLSAWLDPRKWVRQILMLDDSPHSIALGTAIGIFIGLTPTVGAQMVIVMLIALATGWLFRFNRFAALIAVYISNPATTIPIYWFNYRVGTLFYDKTISWSEFRDLFQTTRPGEWMTTLKVISYTVGMPLIVGSILVAVIGSLITYPIILSLAKEVQHHRRHHHAHGAGPKQGNS